MNTFASLGMLQGASLKVMKEFWLYNLSKAKQINFKIQQKIANAWH